MNYPYLVLGSNIEKEVNLPGGVALLARQARLQAISSVYETAPIGGGCVENYLNIAVLLETALDPPALKWQVLRPLERALGRVRTANKVAPRTLDIDIVLWNDEILQLDGKWIPDPDILTCAHICLPLAEIAPDYIHPQSGESLAHIALRFQNTPGIQLRPDIVLAQTLP